MKDRAGQKLVDNIETPKIFSRDHTNSGPEIKTDLSNQKTFKLGEYCKALLTEPKKDKFRIKRL